MMNILVLSHGKFAEGLLDTASMIIGETERAKYLSFGNGDDIDDFEANIRKLLSQGERWIIMTDILGGTPFNIAVKIAFTDLKETHVCYGINVPLFIQIYLNTQTADLDGTMISELEESRNEAFGFVKMED